MIDNDPSYMIWEFYGKRRDYEFTYNKDTKTIKMRWCLSDDENGEWGFDSKEITKNVAVEYVKEIAGGAYF